MMRTAKSRGFTLVELLVVIGIIVLLMALALPIFVQARQEALMTRCASDERQFLTALLSYATDNKGFLPRFDGASGAGNPHDFERLLYQEIVRRGLPHNSFFCPFSDSQLVNVPWTSGSFVQIGYAYWVPRKGGGGLFPPDPPSVNVFGTQIIRGPIRIDDPLGQTNPVITDDVYLYPAKVTNPATFNVATAPPDFFYMGPGYPDSSHLYRGVLYAMNEIFVDGHVERRAPGEVHCIYLSGNALVCR